LPEKICLRAQLFCERTPAVAAHGFKIVSV
jgi:hypothetical protein